mgnify:CR=1 FL=1
MKICHLEPKRGLRPGGGTGLTNQAIGWRSDEFRLQRLEAAELVGQQGALGVPPDEHLEHHLALAVEELHRADAAAGELAVDDIDRSAVGRLDMPADRAVAMDVVIAVAEGAHRQRALEEGRNRGSDRSLYSRSDEPPARAPLRQPPPPLADSQPSYSVRNAAPAKSTALAGPDLAGALSGLRQELKQDIAETLSREIAGLRSEMRSIRTLAEESRPQDDMRQDFTGLA